MAIVTKALIVVALACMAYSMPLEGQEQEAQVDLLSVNEVPQQDANAISDSAVRQKRHGYGGYGGGYGGFGYPAYGGGFGYGVPYGGYGGYGSYGYPSYGYGGYGGYGYGGGFGYGGGLWG